MKVFLMTIILSVTFSFNSQAGDTLVINKKNNQKQKIDISQITKIRFENVTGVDEQVKQKNNIDIKGNYPNPFDENTNIEFELASDGIAVIWIYDNFGNKIQKLECTDCHSGKNSVQWNCTDSNNKKVPSGTYYYEVRFMDEIKSKMMILVK